MLFLAIFMSLLLGLALGAALMFLYLRPRLTAQQGLPEQLNSAISTLMADARTQLLQLAESQLGGKHQLIDQRLSTIHSAISGALEKVQTKMVEIDQQTHVKLATLNQQLAQNAEGMNALRTTTADLNAALSNSRTRGQWGERMAEDVLKFAGMKNNIQYRKQDTLKSEDGGKPRPDFTFLMPEGRVIHMDVKFPMDNYVAYINAENEAGRGIALKQFLRDVRARITETSARDYRNAANKGGETTLDYILIFIPNEQIYAFLMEHDPAMLEDAVTKKVIPCSPTTLLAVLAVIHQASHHFQLEQKSAEIYTLLKNIRRQWEMFTEEMDKMGKKIGEAQSAFTNLVTKRTQGLDRQFDKLQSLPQAEEGTTPTLLSVTKSESELLN